MSELISKKTRLEFREYFVGTTLRHIQQEFDAADIVVSNDFIPQDSGQRRSLVEQYYHTINFSSWFDVKKLLMVYENVFLDLEKRISSPLSDYDKKDAEKRLKVLESCLKRDGFFYKDGRLLSKNATASVQELTEVAGSFDIRSLHLQIERIRKSVEEDPDLAIGTSKELVETVCKTILNESNIQPSNDWDILQLIKETRTVLKLVPENIPDEAKGAEVIKRVLSNLGQIVQGISELRNLYGTGHGKAGKKGGLLPRHARLVASSATGLATFLFETFEERNINK